VGSRGKDSKGISDLFEYVRKFYDGAAKSLTALGKNSEFWSKLHHAAYVALHPED
jgi:hypothetical protein